jgi:hypothetical protein
MEGHTGLGHQSAGSPKFADTPENGLVIRYLMALEGRNIDRVIELFTPDAIIHSPMYGKVPVRDFYTEFFKDSSKAEVTLLGLLGRGENTSGGATTGYWARFSNLLATGARHEFDVVAVMELKGDKISALHIVMDTFFIRATFDEDTGHAPAGQ